MLLSLKASGINSGFTLILLIAKNTGIPPTTNFLYSVKLHNSYSNHYYAWNVCTSWLVIGCTILPETECFIIPLYCQHCWLLIILIVTRPCKLSYCTVVDKYCIQAHASFRELERRYTVYIACSPNFISTVLRFYSSCYWGFILPAIDYCDTV